MQCALGSITGWTRALWMATIRVVPGGFHVDADKLPLARWVLSWPNRPICSGCARESRADRSDVMQKLNVTAVVCITVLGAAFAVRSGVARCSESPKVKPPGPSVLCEEAVVNPISGYAECVRPPGAPVAPP